MGHIPQLIVLVIICVYVSLSAASLPVAETDSVGDSFAFNWEDSLRMATLSAASYCASFSTSSLINWTCSACRDTGIQIYDLKTVYLSGSKSHAIIGYSPNGGGRIVVALSGLQPSLWRDWVLELNTDKSINYSACKGCKVQADMFNAYVLARREIITILSGLKDRWPGAPVYITGHSVGGAIAIHLIADLFNHAFAVTTIPGGDTLVSGGNPAYDLTSPIISEKEAMLLGGTVSTPSFTLMFPTYTFGQPRVGNAEFAAWFVKTLGKTRVYRVTHDHDAVPHVPRTSYGFRHESTEVYLDIESRYRICPTDTADGESVECSNVFTSGFVLSDHAVYMGYKFAPSWTTCP